jgi:hypothetical protein
MCNINLNFRVLYLILITEHFLLVHIILHSAEFTSTPINTNLQNFGSPSVFITLLLSPLCKLKLMRDAFLSNSDLCV